MAFIIKIEYKSKNMAALTLDNGEIIDVSTYAIMDKRITEGSDLSLDELSELKNKSDIEIAKSYVLSYLSKYAVTTEKKLKNKLYDKGYSKDIVEEVICFVKEYGYIDDEEYAKRFIETHKEKWGKSRLKQELYAKGVSADCINNALLTLDTDEMLNAAIKAAEKWYENNYLNDIKSRDKFTRYMTYRGFDYDTVKKCMKHLKETEETDD